MDEALRRLRDRTGITRLLIVGELQREPGKTLSDIAPALGVTVQAVSAHAKELAAQGWLRSDNGSYKVTAKGLQSLHEGVRHLHDSVSALAAPLDVIQVTSAVAAAPIVKGQAVGLFMHDGDLAAKPGAGAALPSRGIAQNAAKPGDEVIVGDLQGMVKLEPGHLTIVTLPSPAEGGVATVDRDRLRRLLKDRPGPSRIGAHGTGATILARTLAGRDRVDFEFAADRAAFNAAERGLDVLLYVTRERLAEVLESCERLNADTLRRVPVEMLEAPERQA